MAWSQSQIQKSNTSPKPQVAHLHEVADVGREGEVAAEDETFLIHGKTKGLGFRVRTECLFVRGRLVFGFTAQTEPLRGSRLRLSDLLSNRV